MSKFSMGIINLCLTPIHHSGQDWYVAANPRATPLFYNSINEGVISTHDEVLPTSKSNQYPIEIRYVTGKCTNYLCGNYYEMQCKLYDRLWLTVVRSLWSH